jgi:hypothetical protein
MQLLIRLFLSLLLHILSNDFFITVTAYSTDKITFRPKFTAPELLFDCRHSFENLSGRQPFTHLDNFGWAIAGDGLHKKMYMVLSVPISRKTISSR